MYDLLKQIATDNNWNFEYSRKDYQNLYDGFEIDKIQLFVDPISTESVFSDSGVESYVYSGQFMILVSSDVDESYSEKYENHIKPLIESASKTIKQVINCSELEIQKYSTLEAINIFDQNLDGLIITYSIKQNY